MPRDQERAEIRRQAVRRFMRDNELTPGEWARKAGLPNPNAIYNFLNGHSKSLSQRTLEILATAVPGATVDMITGSSPARVTSAMATIVVRGGVKSGVWRETVDWEPDKQYSTAVPLSRELAQGAFGMMVEDNAANLVAPPGSILVCVSVQQSGRKIEDGQTVILNRYRRGRVENSVRKIWIDGDVARLVTLTDDTRYLERTDMPWPLPAGATSFESNGETCEIAAIVIGVYRNLVV